LRVDPSQCLIEKRFPIEFIRAANRIFSFSFLSLFLSIYYLFSPPRLHSFSPPPMCMSRSPNMLFP
jgi:hypothetical protein